MAYNTPIEWTDATWNPIRGCTRVSEGCRNCYAEVMAARFSDPGQWGHGVAQRVPLPGGGVDHRWTGKVQLVDESLDLPLRWRKPRRIFVNSTSDLFHESVPDAWIDQVFAVMAQAPQHTFQVLTKRPERARAYLGRFQPVIEPGSRVLTGGPSWMREPAQGAPTPSYVTRDGKLPADREKGAPLIDWKRWPLPNVWLGTSVEDQVTADARIPHLLATPAAVRFISAEPLLGPVDAFDYLSGAWQTEETGWDARRLNWVIVGGESGPGARPMHPDWPRSLRDQCQDAGVAFFFKQWGEFHPAGAGHGVGLVRVGKKAAGRLLDGREWNGLPAGRA